jgi:hypothetical protein
MERGRKERGNCTPDFRFWNFIVGGCCVGSLFSSLSSCVAEEGELAEGFSLRIWKIDDSLTPLFFVSGCRTLSFSSGIASSAERVRKWGGREEGSGDAPGMGAGIVTEGDLCLAEKVSGKPRRERGERPCWRRGFFLLFD